MKRTLLLAAFVLPLLAPLSAQEVVSTFYPLSKAPSDGQGQMGMLVMPPAATDEYLLAWERTGATEKKRIYSAVVLDRATKKEVKRGTIPLDTEASYVEDVITMGKDVCIIYRVHDNKEYHVTLYGLRLSLPELEPVGAPIKLGFYDFPNNGNPFLNDYWFNILPSADGSKWGIMLSKRFKGKGGQEFACWMKDAQLAPLWEQVYQVPTEANRLDNRSVHVTDDGEFVVIYAPVRNMGSFESGYWTLSDLSLSSSIGKVDASGSTINPIAVPAGRILALPEMVATADGFLIGGLLHEKDGKGKTPQAATVVYGADLAPRSEMATVALPGTKAEDVRFVHVHHSGSNTWLFIKHEFELITVLGEGTGVKKVANKMPFADIYNRFTLTSATQEPVAALYEPPKNVEGMRSGADVRTGPTFMMEPAILSWNADGKLSVQQAMKGMEGERDILKQTPRIGYLWTEKGILLDHLNSKQSGLTLVEVK